MKNKIIVQAREITIVKDDYISLTDIARSKNTISFLELWEKINNTNFKGDEFDSFLNKAGFNSSTLSPSKWCEKTSAVGIFTKVGKNGSIT